MTSYRLADGSDALQLANLRWNLRAGDGPAPDPAVKARFIWDFVAWMDKTQDSDLVHWVAEENGALIGVISVRIIHKLPSPGEMDGRFGYLANVHVDAAYRNKRVGTRLLAAVRKWARDQELELLVVWPSERAYPFYERGGYRRYPDPVVLKLD